VVVVVVRGRGSRRSSALLPTTIASGISLTTITTAATDRALLHWPPL